VAHALNTPTTEIKNANLTISNPNSKYFSTPSLKGIFASVAIQNKTPLYSFAAAG
jgi:hypothetical protein